MQRPARVPHQSPRRAPRYRERAPCGYISKSETGTPHTQPMDNLTHTLFGLTLARTPLGRVGRGTTVALVLAANVPDIDFVAAAGGPMKYLEWHRGPTHGALGWARPRATRRDRTALRRHELRGPGNRPSPGPCAGIRALWLTAAPALCEPAGPRLD